MTAATRPHDAQASLSLRAGAAGRAASIDGSRRARAVFAASARASEPGLVYFKLADKRRKKDWRAWRYYLELKWQKCLCNLRHTN